MIHCVEIEKEKPKKFWRVYMLCNFACMTHTKSFFEMKLRRKQSAFQGKAKSTKNTKNKALRQID